jgi:hypothetical protein
MSDDGQRVAYLSSSPSLPPYAAQVIVANADGSGARQITNLPNGAYRALLSGDARYLYVVAGNPHVSFNPGGDQILRYDLEKKSVEMIPAIP